MRLFVTNKQSKSEGQVHILYVWRHMHSMHAE